MQVPLQAETARRAAVRASTGEKKQPEEKGSRPSHKSSCVVSIVPPEDIMLPVLVLLYISLDFGSFAARSPTREVLNTRKDGLKSKSDANTPTGNEHKKNLRERRRRKQLQLPRQAKQNTYEVLQNSAAISKKSPGGAAVRPDPPCWWGGPGGRQPPGEKTKLC